MSGAIQALIGSLAAVAKDPNWASVTLLLPGNGTNGAQNNTFLDASTNNFTITRNGNTTQGTFTPYGSNWSNYFDGTGDYLTAASNTAFALGTGDFTLECWVNVSTVAAAQVAFCTSNNASGNGLLLGIDATTGTPYVYSYPLAARVVTSSIGTSVGTWNHVAVVRNSNTLTVYVNGVSGGSASHTTNYSSTQPTGIGATGDGANPITGYLSNVRLVKGTAVYTANFTPPTAPLTAITNTSLLTCQSNRFIDNSSNAFAITRNGNTNVQRFSPFNPSAAYVAADIGGSGYFDGTGDSLTVPDSTAFTMGSGDFSVEFWYFPTSSVRQLMVAQTNAAGTTVAFWVEKNASNQLRFVVTVGGTQYVGTATATMDLNSWSFIQVVRSGTTVFGYQNGTQVCSASVGSGSLLDSTDVVEIGGVSTGLPITGYISSVRILKGTASSAAVPTAPLTAITNTSLLLNFTNAGIIDNAMLNDLETVGNAQISTAQSKFGGSSMAFDGAGDWLTAPNSVNYDLGSGDFTVELWVYFNSVGSLIYFVVEGSGINASPLATAGWALNYSTNNLQFNRYNGTTQTTYSFAWTPATGTWYHVAVSRSGTSLRAFVDGTQVGTTQTSSVTFNKINSTEPLTVGNGLSGGSPGTNYSLNGYIDDLRITKGVARYTANFTPPTAAFPTS